MGAGPIGSIYGPRITFNDVDNKDLLEIVSSIMYQSREMENGKKKWKRWIRDGEFARKFPQPVCTMRKRTNRTLIWISLLIKAETASS